MGQVLHGSAKKTHAIRAAIQRSKATIAGRSIRRANRARETNVRFRTIYVCFPLSSRSAGTLAFSSLMTHSGSHYF